MIIYKDLNVHVCPFHCADFAVSSAHGSIPLFGMTLCSYCWDQFFPNLPGFFVFTFHVEYHSVLCRFSLEGWSSVTRFNQTSEMTAATLNDRPKSVRNRWVFKVLDGFLCYHLTFLNLLLVWGNWSYYWVALGTSWHMWSWWSRVLTVNKGIYPDILHKVRFIAFIALLYVAVLYRSWFQEGMKSSLWTDLLNDIACHIIRYLKKLFEAI